MYLSKGDYLYVCHELMLAHQMTTCNRNNDDTTPVYDSFNRYVEQAISKMQKVLITDKSAVTKKQMAKVITKAAALKREMREGILLHLS